MASPIGTALRSYSSPYPSSPTISSKRLTGMLTPPAFPTGDSGLLYAEFRRPAHAGSGHFSLEADGAWSRPPGGRPYHATLYPCDHGVAQVSSGPLASVAPDRSGRLAAAIEGSSRLSRIWVASIRGRSSGRPRSGRGSYCWSQGPPHRRIRTSAQRREDRTVPCRPLRRCGRHGRCHVFEYGSLNSSRPIASPPVGGGTASRETQARQVHHSLPVVEGRLAGLDGS